MEDFMHMSSFVPNKKLNVLSLIVISIIIPLIFSSARADSLQLEFEQYFYTLEESFNTMANSSVLKKTRLYSMDRYFVSSLKKYQTIYSFIRTNSKGVIISEVIRGQTPERNFRKVRNQKWFNFVKRSQEDYHTLIKIRETGRYYLLWCKPIVKGNKYFVGALAAKVDLWDCIHKISSNIDQPFLVRLGSKSLYSYQWKDIDTYDRIPLSVLGVKSLSLYIEKEEVEVEVEEEEEVSQEQEPDTAVIAMTKAKQKQEPDTAVIAMTEAKKKPESVVQKKEVKKKSSSTSSRLVKTVLIFVIFIVVIFIIIAVLYISRLRQRTLWQKIDKGEL
jgi:hypothetical protein